MTGETTMTYQFKAGDYIRVRYAPGSPWQDLHGTIVDIIRQPGDESSQECGVDFNGNLRWFLAEHLVKAVHPRLVRFFRSEVLDRWKLSNDDVEGLNGDRDQLIALLRDQHDFSMRRAAAEVDEFYIDFEKRLEQARNIGPLATAA